MTRRSGGATKRRITIARRRLERRKGRSATENALLPFSSVHDSPHSAFPRDSEYEQPDRCRTARVAAERTRCVAAEEDGFEQFRPRDAQRPASDAERAHVGQVPQSAQIEAQSGHRHDDTDHFARTLLRRQLLRLHRSRTDRSHPRHRTSLCVCSPSQIPPIPTPRFPFLLLLDPPSNRSSTSADLSFVTATVLPRSRVLERVGSLDRSSVTRSGNYSTDEFSPKWKQRTRVSSSVSLCVVRWC